MFFGIDPIYLIITAITLVISFGAQLMVRNAYGRYGKVANSRGMTGPQTAEFLMRHTGLNVNLERTQQELSDHYDPSSHTVRMSPPVAERPSVASMAIVAHELGHAQQHDEGSILIQARNVLVPAVRISPQISYLLIMAGFLLQITGIVWLGIILYGVSVVFAVVTLPVEFDASRRALVMLDESGAFQTDEERQGARSMLTAAALTYVAAAATAVIYLLYYISLAQRRR